jgi:hypothetical protein
MHCFLFSDWATLRIGTSAPPVISIVQGEEEWLDVSPYQDLVAWLDVRELTTPGVTLYMDFQTAPVKDEAYFASLLNNGGGFNLSNAGTPGVVRMTRNSAYTPLSRWLRWNLNTNGVTPTATGDVTFRIWLAANYATGSSARQAPSNGARRPCGCA